MCRIFGFRSVIESQVHQSLIQADNALLVQSKLHDDGWGIAYYRGGIPHLVKSSQSAWSDTLFKKLSGVVSSNTVLAHLRKATVGSLSNVNTHPFQYGRWTFVHNGNLKDFANKRNDLINRIDKTLQRFILGETDTECIFFLILTHLQRQVNPLSQTPNTTLLESSVKFAIAELKELFGPIQENDDGDPSDQYLTFLLTDGRQLIAHQGGKKLYYSTHKNQCAQRDSCPAFAATCETFQKDQPVQHLLVSSEILHGENVWEELAPNSLLALHEDRRISISSSIFSRMDKVSFSPLSGP